MATRPARDEDLPAITALQRLWDTHWFGSPEHDETEVRLTFDRAQPLMERSLVIERDDGALVAAAWWWSPQETTLVADPRAAAQDWHDALIEWLSRSAARAFDVLDRDHELRDSLQRHGWRHERSAFELVREVTPDWELAAPQWPDGVEVRQLRPAEYRAAHDLVYSEAGWTTVPGHAFRDYAEWLGLFLADAAPDQQLVACEGDRLVGLAIGRTFSDGTGWVSQLAVPTDQRGRGIGRALLLESMRVRVAGGAVQLGLGVSATNVGALQLYLGVGLRVDREWMSYRHPDAVAAT